MKPRSRSSFVTTLALLPLLLVLAGASECRFGNHVEYPREPWAGVYEMAPKEVLLGATFKNGSTDAMTGTAADIPTYLAVSLTNPVYLFIDAKQPTSGALTDPKGNGKYAFPLLLDEQGKMNFRNPLQPNPVWFSDCEENLEFHVDGSVNKDAGPLTTGAGYDIRGRIGLHVIAQDTFTGSCTASLQAAAACLGSLTQCNGGPAGSAQNNQDYVRSIFGVHLDAHLIQASDLPNLTSVVHEITYE